MTAEVPRPVHHYFEVLVVVNGGGDVVVVLDELCEGDFVVGGVVVDEVVVDLEGFQELGEDLVFGFTAFENCGVLGG